MSGALDFTQLRGETKKQVEGFLAKCAKNAPAETLYGVAVCVDSDVTSLYLQANSEEALGHPGDRYFINEWKYADNRAAGANSALETVWRQAEVLTKGVRGTDEPAAQVRRDCLAAIVQGLQDVRASEAIPKTVREHFALFVYDPDPDDPDEFRAIAQQLNSNSTYQAIVDDDSGFPY